MNIEIRGAEFVNKGAELMLYTVIHELSERIPNVKFVVEPKDRIPYEKRVQNDLYAIVRYRRFRIYWGLLLKYLPKKYRKELGIKIEREIDAVIDISGFAYGDYWGSKKLKGHLSDHLKRWNKKNIKILLLPQALGSFEEKEIRNEFKKVVKFADFICARDSVSFSHVVNLHSPNDENVYQYPDITASLPVVCEKSYYDNYILLIPNSKMLKSGEYITYLSEVALFLNSLDKDYAFLIHEGDDDLEIAKEVNKKTGLSTEIIKDKSAIEIKKIIGNSKIILTSRYHGLVNGLSQGVPSLTTSWSHKYEMVLDYYQFSEGLIKDLEDIDITKQKINYLINNYSIVKNKITQRAKDHKNELNEMWDNVEKILIN